MSNVFLPGPSQNRKFWPSLPLAEWNDTCETLHMWTQIVGKVRMALTPPVNHWWHTTLYVSACGLTTSAIPYAEGLFEIEFDFVRHQLVLRTSTRRTQCSKNFAAALEVSAAPYIFSAGVSIWRLRDFPDDLRRRVPGLIRLAQKPIRTSVAVWGSGREVAI